jgi:hypothetical protein
MCGKSKTTTNTVSNQKTHQETGPEQWVRDEGKSLYNDYKSLVDGQIANNPTYEGERVAQMGEDWTAAKDLLHNLQTPTGDFDKARGALDGVLASSQPKTVEELMNPYIGTVLDANLRKMREAHLANQTQLGGQASMSGAFGDARHGVEEGVMNRGYVDSVGDITNKTYSEGWNTAQTQQNTMLDRLQSLAPMYQGLDASQFNRDTKLADYLGKAAATDRSIDQEQINVDYSDWVEARDRPIALSQSLIDVLNKTPHKSISDGTTSGTSTSTQTSPNTGGWQLAGQIAGGIVGGPIGASIGGSLAGGMAGGGAAAPPPMTSPLYAQRVMPTYTPYG